MRSSFLKRHVNGLWRRRSSPDGSDESAQDEETDEPTTPSSDAAMLAHCYLAGIDGRRIDFPEVYCGKTGLDIPCIQLEKMDKEVVATYTGPDGGLTQVSSVRRGPVAQMANLDDEMSLSTDGMSSCSDEDDDDAPLSQPARLDKASSNLLLGSCSSLLGPNGSAELPEKAASSHDWSRLDEERAFGVSVSLYEKNPLTGVNAGDPIADVWGVAARSNNAVLSLADGVNWGEGARLAARCAIRGATEHLNQHIETKGFADTTEIFHELLASFHSAHSLILQEGGQLTTLAVAVVAPAKHTNSWVLCVCNVGDSLCFVYNTNYGVREVTLGSHDIDQNRDMRDAGGALGPVDGRNPQLHNLTCSMTFVEQGDVVFITSDGVSDNLDPVVGRFCVIRQPEDREKENAHLPKRDERRKISVSAKENPREPEYARARTCNASLPIVDAAQRHQLMLVRMRDVIANGLSSAPVPPSSPTLPLFPPVTAYTLCQNLVQFATQLSQAKRRTLENPELYRREKMSKSEQRARRRMVKEQIGEMPGKLDHASVVAYRVGMAGSRADEYPHQPCLSARLGCSQGAGSEEAERCETVTVNLTYENFHRIDRAGCSGTLLDPRGDRAHASHSVSDRNSLSELISPREEAERMEAERRRRQRATSPYEDMPPALPSLDQPVRRKKHARGSAGRHTLGVDVQWLKGLVTKKPKESRGSPPQTPIHTIHSEIGDEPFEKLSLKQRIRGLLGSKQNVSVGGERQLDRPTALPVQGRRYTATRV